MSKIANSANANLINEDDLFTYICAGAGALILIIMFVCAACGVS
jgi:hypothetical protein